ncbi:FeoB-associated Cys-rich membrane protein [Marinifilum caeruleilacunae]|uniref:FeoB-associated Cys-rich membrane protein n=1 Tax=Marinifilum caeruleilacunae TaxID=2499076 RepID=A0ABX1WSR5_9BACT|nr:FeoB-associated Cys-rich membrane protein [Marinifilum caeruleilacunae]NOU58958.1 FeoB-associated Cys-rich membrane protein [Marinifilum caeruleilacunae]
MSIQLILTYLIIAYAVGYTCYHTVRMIMKQRESACGGGCSGCEIKDEIKKRGIQPVKINKNDSFTYIKN